VRSVPIELLDVAGLVPGAHEGKGLGNKFLDDLRHADALIHVVDASGTVDAEGKETRGYDPSVDIAWLRSEIVAWVMGNLWTKWGSIKRRHQAVKATAVETLQNQFSGYGSTSTTVVRALDRLALKEPLEDWDQATVERVVNAFVDEKFPTVIALNKIDHPDADKNISKIAKMQDPETIVLCSAISEIFLRKMAKQGYIKYTEGSEFVDTREDLIEQGDPTGGDLKELDEKNRNRIENLKDMVLYRFGSTGVVQVLSKAARLLGLVPVFPVRNTATFASGASESRHVFRDCVLVKKNSTVGDVARKVMGDAPIAYVEGIGGTRVSEDDLVLVGKNDVCPLRASTMPCTDSSCRFCPSRSAGVKKRCSIMRLTCRRSARCPLVKRARRVRRLSSRSKYASKNALPRQRLCLNTQTRPAPQRLSAPATDRDVISGPVFAGRRRVVCALCAVPQLTAGIHSHQSSVHTASPGPTLPRLRDASPGMM
jgi:ribosome-binding ATPase YchF (GTP1/OBG family)